MKKIFAMMLVAVLGLTGCSNSVEAEETPEPEVEPTVKLSELAPNPEELFDEMEFVLMIPEKEEIYQFCLNHADHAMFDIYVEASKKAGFVDANCILENNYQAYTEDGKYWIAVTYFPGTITDPDSTYVYVDVRVAKEKGESND